MKLCFVSGRLVKCRECSDNWTSDIYKTIKRVYTFLSLLLVVEISSNPSNLDSAADLCCETL